MVCLQAWEMAPQLQPGPQVLQRDQISQGSPQAAVINAKTTVPKNMPHCFILTSLLSGDRTVLG